MIMELQDWRLNGNELEFEPNGILGRGSFGTVYTARWRGTPCAVKQFKNISLLPIDDHDLARKELTIMSTLHHPNVVHLFGYTEEPYGIVMEVMPMTLAQWMKQHHSTSAYYNCLLGIARGLAYLHNRQPQSVIHRDIKPTNILVTLSGKPKLCDFGVSCLFERTPGMHTGDVGSRVYMAPEILQISCIYNDKSDIFSMGMLIYEMFEGHKPMLHPDLDRHHLSIVQGVRPTFCKTPKAIRTLVSRMWDSNQEKRPSSLEVIEELEDIISQHRTFFTCF